MAALYRSELDESTIRRWCIERLDAWSTPHSTVEIETNLGTTHLSSAGTGADLCVYLPGTNFNAATSTGLLTLLAGSCRVVCVDLPGQPGLSTATRPDEHGDIRVWLASIIDSCRTSGDVDRVVLAGHSRGAALALEAGPEGVDSLVLLSPAGLARVHLTAALLLRSTAWLLRPSERRSARLVDLMAGGAPFGDAGPLVEWMTLVARSTRTSGAPGPLPPELLERWRGHDVRVLVGEHDTFFPPGRLSDPASRRLAVPLEVVRDAGHLLVDQQGQAVVEAVAGAFARGGES